MLVNIIIITVYMLVNIIIFKNRIKVTIMMSMVCMHIYNIEAQFLQFTIMQGEILCKTCVYCIVKGTGTCTARVTTKM